MSYLSVAGLPWRSSAEEPDAGGLQRCLGSPTRRSLRIQVSFFVAGRGEREEYGRKGHMPRGLLLSPASVGKGPRAGDDLPQRAPHRH
jgi:hypothetical protein